MKESTKLLVACAARAEKKKIVPLDCTAGTYHQRAILDVEPPDSLKSQTRLPDPPLSFSSFLSLRSAVTVMPIGGCCLLAGVFHVVFPAGAGVSAPTDTHIHVESGCETVQRCL